MWELLRSGEGSCMRYWGIMTADKDWYWWCWQMIMSWLSDYFMTLSERRIPSYNFSTDWCFIAGRLDMTDCWWSGRGRPPTCYTLTSSQTPWTSLWRSRHPSRQSSMNRPSPSLLSRWVGGLNLWESYLSQWASEDIREGRGGESVRGKLIAPICYQNYQQVVGAGEGNS